MNIIVRDKQIVIQGEISEPLVKRLAAWCVAKPKQTKNQLVWQLPSARVAQHKAEIMKKDLHYMGLLNAEELFESPTLAQEMWGRRPC